MGNVRKYFGQVSDKVIWIMGILIIVTGVFFSSWSKINLKEYESYTLYNNVFEEIQTNSLDTQYSVEIFDDNILQYTISLVGIGNFEGEGQLKIYDNDVLLAEVPAVGRKNAVIFDLKEVYL